MWIGALVASALIGSLSLLFHERYVASIAAVHETIELQKRTDGVLSLMRDAETGQRGFILTGDDAFLRPYQEAKEQLPGALAQLARLAKDPAQSESIRVVRGLSELKMLELAQTIEHQQRGRNEQALAIVREGRGRRWMEGLRAELGHMLERENRQFHERERAAQRRQRELATVLAGVWGFLLCLVAGGIWSATRGVAEAKRTNEWLTRSEKALRAVADNATDLVRIIGEHAELLYVSPSCERILGFSQSEMLDMGPRALLPEEEQEAARSLAEQVRSGQADGKPFVHRLKTRSGNYRWFETSYALVREGAEQSAHIHLMSRDITERRQFEEALMRQTVLLEAVLDSMADGVVVLDDHRKFLVVNPAARDYIHQDEGETAPVEWARRHQAFLPDGKTPFPSDQGPLTLALNGKASDGVQLVLHDRSGSARSFSVSARPIRVGSLSAGCVALYRDITRQRKADLELQESEQRLRVLSEASFEGIAITKGGVIVDTNENFASWIGATREELAGTAGLSCFAPADRDRVWSNSQSDALYEAHLMRRDGSAFPVEVRGRFQTFRGELVRIAVIRDITEKRRREAELKEQADLLRSLSLHDELTSLYNRRGFLEHASMALRRSVRDRQPACLFFADLNGMKHINDTFGHEVGDRAIASTGQLLVRVFRDSDIVARLGGDEFAVFAPQCAASDVETIRRRLNATAADVNATANEPFSLSISLGASSFVPGQTSDLAALMEAADRAMYSEKRARGKASPVRAQGT